MFVMCPALRCVLIRSNIKAIEGVENDVGEAIQTRERKVPSGRFIIKAIIAEPELILRVGVKRVVFINGQKMKFSRRI